MADIFPPGTPEHLRKVYEKYADKLLKDENIVGVGIGSTIRDGKEVECISIHVKYIANVPKDFPTHLDGVPVELEDTGGGIIPL